MAFRKLTHGGWRLAGQCHSHARLEKGQKLEVWQRGRILEALLGQSGWLSGCLHYLECGTGLEGGGEGGGQRINKDSSLGPCRPMMARSPDREYRRNESPLLHARYKRANSVLVKLGRSPVLAGLEF